MLLKAEEECGRLMEETEEQRRKQVELRKCKLFGFYVYESKDLGCSLLGSSAFPQSTLNLPTEVLTLITP
jgi:hypothetical protein